MAPVFDDYSLMMVLIEKDIGEMILDMDRVIEFFFHLNMSFYIRWD